MDYIGCLPPNDSVIALLRLDYVGALLTLSYQSRCRDSDPTCVDVIFAIDSSADTEYNWPNDSSLVATYERNVDSSGNLAMGHHSLPLLALIQWSTLG